VTVPEVQGKKKADASLLLSNAGFLIEEVSVTDAPEKDGTAIETDPPAGTQLAEGKTIKLKVSTRLPNLAGESIAEAEKALRALGLRPTVLSL
jgi:eukaryotic-like serine/threonine-protein kinase